MQVLVGRLVAIVVSCALASACPSERRPIRDQVAATHSEAVQLAREWLRALARGDTSSAKALSSGPVASARGALLAQQMTWELERLASDSAVVSVTDNPPDTVQVAFVDHQRPLKACFVLLVPTRGVWHVVDAGRMARD